MKKVWMLFLPSLLWCASNLFDENVTSDQETMERCMTSAEIKSSKTPVTFFSSAARCIEEDRYEQAVELYLVAVAYGYFDSMRAADQTSSADVIEQLKINYFSRIDSNKRNRFAQMLRLRLDNLAPTCQLLKKIGKPNYYPRYMVEALKNPFTKQSKDGLMPNYDAENLWTKTRFEYLHCF